MAIAGNTAAVIAALTLLWNGAAAWTLVDDYNSGNWFNSFGVQSIPDPTHGYVNYVTQSQAQSEGFYRIQGSQVHIGVDNTTILDPNGTGRNSVRLQSNKAYTHGLVIADFAHMPGTECGSWPAFWMVGPNWPNDGEIDIIEGVDLIGSNSMTLHSAPGCNVQVGPGGQSGSSGATGCGQGGGYSGCGVSSNVGTSYGTPFNAAGGGVYALQWTSSAIQIWYFARSQIPADITAGGGGSGSPDPAGWGAPQANFAGCAFDQYFQQLQIIFDVTFCGDWAGQVWGSYARCQASNASCAGYVASTPGAFSDTYWLVNSVRVFQ